MAFSYRLTDDARVLLTEYEGDITSADLQRSQAARSELLREVGTVRWLINDFTRCGSFDVPTDSVRSHAEVAHSRLADTGPSLSIAFVVPPGLAHGLARMWTAHVEELGWRVQLCRDRAEAEQWLRAESGLPLTFADRSPAGARRALRRAGQSSRSRRASTKSSWNFSPRASDM